MKKELSEGKENTENIKRKTFFSKKTIILTGLLLLALVFCVWQNNYLTVTCYEYHNENLPEEFDGYRILQISDYHNKQGLFWEDYFWEEVRALQPDIIVITGDLLDSTRKDISNAIRVGEQCAEVAPAYFITGNHEFWVESELRQTLLDGLENAGVMVLDNQAVFLCEEVVLLGLSDRDLTNETLSRLCEEELRREDSENYVSILLAHEPQFLSFYANCGVDLVLSGHAHGGQIRLPGIGGIYAPDQGFNPEYTDGMHQAGDTTMIISRGIGNSVFPLRLFNYPELVLVTLRR